MGATPEWVKQARRRSLKLEPGQQGLDEDQPREGGQGLAAGLP